MTPGPSDHKLQGKHGPSRQAKGLTVRGFPMLSGEVDEKRSGESRRTDEKMEKKIITS